MKKLLIVLCLLSGCSDSAAVQIVCSRVCHKARMDVYTTAETDTSRPMCYCFKKINTEVAQFEASEKQESRD